jgi:hypothetical protein
LVFLLYNRQSKQFNLIGADEINLLIIVIIYSSGISSFISKKITQHSYY